jgi:rubrerythrin
MSKELFRDKATLLKHAVKGEEDGAMFYDLLSQAAANPTAKKRLEGLRDDEKRHKAILTSLYKKYVGGEVGALPDKGIGALAQVFEKGKLRRLKSEMEYINLAIEAELATARYYKSGIDAVAEPDFKEILHQLVEEEDSHYEILMAEREALSGNYFWFATEDSAPMED